MKPRLLDLFCGAGGAGKGYADAGFEVVGVDIEPQPNYPFEFHQEDAVEALAWMHTDRLGDAWLLRDFDAIHASPPCQRYTTMGQRFATTQAEHPDLIAGVRGRLLATGLPYMIENVVGARRELEGPIWLCGRQFGLGVGRHRLFECSFGVMSTQCVCDGSELPVYGKLDGRRVWTRKDGSELRAARTLEQAQAAMGIDWMTWDELRESIPPPYTEHIGQFLMQHIEAENRAAA